MVTLVISNYLAHRILINNGSSADILYLPAFDQMGVGQDKLRPVQMPLVGFNGDRLLPLGVISLSVTTGTGDLQITQMIDFLVVDYPSANNAILGRLALNRLRVVTSTYHLLMCFPTEEGVRKVRGN